MKFSMMGQCWSVAGRGMGIRLAVCGLVAGAAAAPMRAGGAVWMPEKVVIVVEENRSADQVYGNVNMPYFNQLAGQGAKFTNAHFAQTPYNSAQLTRPSQPNYMYLFSGNNQGVLPSWYKQPSTASASWASAPDFNQWPYKGTATNESNGDPLGVSVLNTNVGIGNNLIPAGLRPFDSPNLGHSIIASGHTFAGFSESLPYPHYDGVGDISAIQDNYRRKHNPMVNWASGLAGTGADNQFTIPITASLAFEPTHDPVDNQDYAGFARAGVGSSIDYATLPTVSFVVPNEQHDAHSNTDAMADLWLVNNIKGYADWAMTHNSLLIVTYDEDGSSDDRIATVFYGPMVQQGVYDQYIDHLNVLSTVLDLYGALGQFKADYEAVWKPGLPQAEFDALFGNLKPVEGVFINVPEPVSGLLSLVVIGFVGLRRGRAGR